MRCLCAWSHGALTGFEVRWVIQMHHRPSNRILQKVAPSSRGDCMKMREWKTWHQIAGVGNKLINYSGVAN